MAGAPSPGRRGDRSPRLGMRQAVRLPYNLGLRTCDSCVLILHDQPVVILLHHDKRPDVARSRVSHHRAS
jgi:hypothetical protein